MTESRLLVEGPSEAPRCPVVDSMYAGDERELVRHEQAMASPANSGIRGLEIVTNGRGNAVYWQSMTARTGTPGSTRHVP
ncbi:restriction endonuclease fold toxin-2 domain-containing protein [Streptomyces sp. WAC08241]|uniref:restriction endonuclease fold toxin-2 domain-containing protein n=1 Tax=Streptomyces sp. WAC08241 TaxID=2487421 RepID=UPI00163D276F|nr:restriction endonuclease fold toxin-2 domain-containing protein [Streptomyces sp. WAC08241]